MKKIVKYGILFLALMLFCTISVSAQDERGYITAQGSADMEVSPDLAMVRLSVMTEDKDVKVAQVGNRYIIDAVIKSVQSLGIKEEDIQTVGYTVYPVYDTDGFKNRVKYYQVRNTILVETKNLDLVGQIIDTAVENGANEVDSIQFTLTKEKERSIYVSLIGDAARNCKSDAEIMATALGTRIVGVKDASLYRSGIPVYYSKYSSMEARSVPAPDMDTAIEPGMITMSVTLSASFFIE